MGLTKMLKFPKAAQSDSPLLLPDGPGHPVHPQVVEHSPVGAAGAHLVGARGPQLTPVPKGMPGCNKVHKDSNFLIAYLTGLLGNCGNCMN